MKCTVELNEADIRGIIAEKYGVLPADVYVGTSKEYVGQGPMEHEAHVAVAKVNFTEADVKERLFA